MHQHRHFRPAAPSVEASCSIRSRAGKSSRLNLGCGALSSPTDTAQYSQILNHSETTLSRAKLILIARTLGS